MRAVLALIAVGAGLMVLWRVFREWNSWLHLFEVAVACGLVGGIGGSTQGIGRAVAWGAIGAVGGLVLYWALVPPRPTVKPEQARFPPGPAWVARFANIGVVVCIVASLAFAVAIPVFGRPAVLAAIVFIGLLVLILTVITVAVRLSRGHRKGGGVSRSV